MLHVTTSELAGNTEALLDRVNAENEAIIVSRADRVVAVIMPATDQSLHEELEDRLDIEAARLARAESGEEITLVEYKRKQGL